MACSGDAGRAMSDELRLDFTAFVEGDRAARSEGTPRDHVRQRWRFALQRNESLGSGCRQVRHRAQQPGRVGHLRSGEDLFDRPGLHQATGIHHRDAVRVARNHTEVVRDEHNRSACDLTRLLQDLEDLGLDRDIERGGRLIGDDEVRIVGNGDGDHGSLTHATGELVGVCPDPTFGPRYADDSQQLDRSAVCSILRQRWIVEEQTF